MSQVADTMRFITTDRVAGMPAGESSFRCRFEGTRYRDLGRDVEQTCKDPAYCSPYLTDAWTRGGGADAIQEADPVRGTLDPRRRIGRATAHVG